MAFDNDAEFTRARIAKLEEMILAFEGRILALESGQTYVLETAQTRETTTQPSLSSLRATLEGLMNQRAVLRARLYGTGGHVVKPGF